MSGTSGTALPQSTPPGPLTGVRVLDLTIARAGPSCVRQLADMGADVVRVSHPNRGDLGGSDAHNLHRGKRSLLLDLKDERGREVFLRLARWADVLVENFRPDVKHRLRIDYETLRPVNERLVYASISGFGQDGPYGQRAGVDQIAQGMGGLMSVTGPPGSGPWRTGIAISDTAAGTLLALGVLAALVQRQHTGRGQWVHTSLLEAMVGFMDFQATRWLIDGVVPPQAGNDHPTIFPMGTFRTADGWLNVAPALNWEGFVRAIEAPELLEDPRFAGVADRYRHREALRAEIDAILAHRTTEEWVEIVNAVGIPCGPVLAVDEVFADPQVRHLELAQTVEHATDGPVTLLRNPINFSESPSRIRGAAPVPGAHTREILIEQGYDADEVDALVEAGVASTAARSGSWTSA
jgi:crotonobetainyl-CoA:carnitine CoA-transferase CaiB-like acyl-CoA transferase